MTRRATRAADSDDVAKWSAQLEAMEPPRALLRTKPDGSCLFRAFAIAFEGSDAYHEAYRIKAVDFMTNNQDHFMAFLCPSSKGAFLKYCQLMRRPGCWGGHLELTALAEAYQVNVSLHRIGRPVESLIHVSDTAPRVELAFHTAHTEHYSAVLAADEALRSLPAHAKATGGGAEEPRGPAPRAPLGEAKLQANQPAPAPAATFKKEGKAAQKPSGAGAGTSQAAKPPAAEPEGSKSPSEPAASTGLGLGALDLGPGGPAEPRTSASGGGAGGAGGGSESATPTAPAAESDPGHPSLEDLEALSLADLKALYFEVLGVKTRLRTPSKIVAILMGAYKVERALRNNSQEV